MSMMNRLANTRNEFQGERKRVLCVCSAGLLRSPTAAWVLSNAPWDFNTRACGAVAEYALIPLDPVLVRWADEIVVMNSDQEEVVLNLIAGDAKPVHRLDIPDSFPFRDDMLVDKMRLAFREIWPEGGV